jgi:succinyl-diaminopimelate desuccinylase
MMADAVALADPVRLAQDLIRCPSVTPADAGALDVLQSVLAGLGFTCTRLPFQAPGSERIDNLYARLGDESPHFCFAGHTDVVPVGDRAGWSVDPFAGEIRDGRLYGRGAADMKGGIAAFVGAVAQFLARHGRPPGSISLLITGDEEAVAINGTRPMLEWLAARGQTIDGCLVGEPTSVRHLGDMIKIGRRGSMSVTLTALGVQGHVAYPHLADNPLPRLVRALSLLVDRPLDHGTPFFQPSTLALTSIDVDNPAGNIIPSQGTGRFNIRFNDLHTPATLERDIKAVLTEIGGQWDIQVQVSGVAFLTPPGPLSAMVAEAIHTVTGQHPDHSTSGGTSDARFIKDYCPVVECGLVGASMHKADENVAVADIEQLAAIYRGVLERWFSGAGRP